MQETQETRIGKIPWRRAWQPTPVFLPWESHGQRSLVGYSPCGLKVSDTTEMIQLTHMAWDDPGFLSRLWGEVLESSYHCAWWQSGNGSESTMTMLHRLPYLAVSTWCCASACVGRRSRPRLPCAGNVPAQCTSCHREGLSEPSSPMSRPGSVRPCRLLWLLSHLHHDGTHSW